jgi:ADP-ribose pyrophosphatase
MEFILGDRRRVYSGRAFDVDQVSVQLPDGRSGVYDLVEHQGSVSILPLDEDGNILFVRQYRLGSHSLLLELPAGMRPAEESPLDCAARELREETGMAAGRLTLLGDFYLAPGYCSEHMHIFLAQELRPDPLKGDADEFLEVVRISVQETYLMIQRGEQRDGKSLAALMLAQSMIYPGKY